MRVAALDLGSNTSLMLIAEVVGEKIVSVIADESRITRLAQGLHETQRIHVDALARMKKCFEEYRGLMDHHKVERIVAVATSAARDAINSNELIELAQSYAIPIQVIDGVSEAKLTFKGGTFEFEQVDGLIVIDIGGASTEIIGCAKGQGELTFMSLDIGSVRLTESCLTGHPVVEAELLGLQKKISSELEKLDKVFNFDDYGELIAVAGTPTTLTSVLQEIDFNENRVHAYSLGRSELAGLSQKLSQMSVEERQALPGMPAKRADVIVAGSQILLEFMGRFKIEQAFVSTKGVRYGLALSSDKYLSS